MKPARPFHVNPPRRTSNGKYLEGSYEVVGHRDGPVVARFPFDPSEPEYIEQARKLAEALCENPAPYAGRLLDLARRVAEHFEGTDAPLGVEARALVRLIEGAR